MEQDEPEISELKFDLPLKSSLMNSMETRETKVTDNSHLRKSSTYTNVYETVDDSFNVFSSNDNEAQSQMMKMS